MAKFDFLNKIKDKFKNINVKGKKLIFIAVAAIFVMVAICISALSSNKKTKTEGETSTQFSVSSYASSIEKKLESMLINMEQISKVSAFVMVEASPEVEYLTETEESTTTNNSGSSTTTKSTKPVFEKNGSVSSAVVVSTKLPKILGVMILVNSITTATKINIISSVSVVLNIDESRISILQER